MSDIWRWPALKLKMAMRSQQRITTNTLNITSDRCTRVLTRTKTLAWNFLRLIRILFLGLGKAEENANARNDTHHYSDTAADRRTAELGYSRGWGYYPGGGLGIILIIVIILVLMGRV
jgi:hypothetical protein